MIPRLGLDNGQHFFFNFFFLEAVYREHSVHMPQVKMKLMG